MADPYNDNGSLRPHALPSHGLPSDDEIEWPPRSQRTRNGAWRWPLVIGIALGVGASVPLTGWAVGTHRWPGSGPTDPAAAAPRSALPPPAPSPPAAAAPVNSSDTHAPDGAGAEPASSSSDWLASASATKDAATGKLHKKRKGLGHHAAAHAGDAQSSAVDPGTGASATKAEETEPGPPKSRAPKPPAAHAAAAPAAEPATPVEDQAAAELSTSLK